MPQLPRGRKPRACDSCRSKKIQCDRAVPRCNYCEHHGLACTYAQAERKVGSAARPRLSPQNFEGLRGNLPSTVQSCEVDLDVFRRSASSDADEERNPSNFEGFRLLNGLPFISEEGQQWIEDKAGARLPHKIIHKFRLPWQSPRDSMSPESRPHLINGPGHLNLPPRQAVEKLAVRFCSSIHSLVFPVLGLGLFLRRTLHLAYEETDGDQYGVSSAKACVLALLAIVDMFGQNTDQDIPDLKSICQSYVSEIEESLPSVLREMTVNSLEALTMLIVYKYFVGELHSASFLVSISTRLIFRLGAHLPPNPTNSYEKNSLVHHVRDLFWVCYCIDKDLTHRLGQPPAVNDDHCDLKLPFNYVQMQSSNILGHDRLSSLSSTTVPLYPWDLRLSIIKSRIYNSLHSISASKQSETEILRRIRWLDEELEDWRLTLPLDHRPTLMFLEETPVDVNTNTQAAMLRLAYHHCVILIHQVRSRMFGSNFSTPSLAGEGQEANLQVLNDASKSTLLYLEKMLPVLAHECFWVVIFYPLTALFNIFFNTLLHTPTDSMSENLALLQNFPRVLRQIPVRNLTVAEISQLEFIEELTIEMNRLALAAV